MKILTGVPTESLRQLPELTETLDAQGFSGISTQENRHNPFLPLAIAAVHSKHLELRTNVAIAFARSPMVAAGLAWDLQSASEGRFVLGLGSQVKGHNQRRFSVPWSAPAPRLKEYVESIQAIWTCWRDGTPLNYSGEHYQFSLMTPNFTPEPLRGELPKLQIAAVGPAIPALAMTTSSLSHCSLRAAKTDCIAPSYEASASSANSSGCNTARAAIAAGSLSVTAT